MAGATVIDQLIVKLGLDPRDFTKGQKQAAAEMVKTEGQVKKSSESMGRSLLGFTGKLLGVVSAAVVVKKAISYVSDLSASVRQLGLDSRNFGMAANEMRNFQNIGEMMGGKAEDVTKTIGGLTKAVYDLAYNGQISDSLVMLGRLGVQFQDTAGNARNFKDIVIDAEAAIQRSMKHGTSYANANQMLLQAGFDPGLAKAMLTGNVRQQLAQQKGRRQVTGESVRAATSWEQSATNRDQAVSAAALRVLPAEAATGKFANDKIAAGAEHLSDATFKGTLEEITKVTDAVGHALEDGASKIKSGARSFIDSIEAFGARVQERYKQHPYGDTSYRDIASGKWGTSDAQMQKDNTVVPQATNHSDKVLNYATGAMPTPGAQNSSSTSSRTEVNIARVEVNTQATKTDDIARNFAGAVTRKMHAAQADKGMQ